MSQTEDEFRANLIEVGRDAMGRNDGWRWWHPRHLASLLDFWEPLIRADERERQTAMCAAAVAERDAARAEVRALLHIRALMEKDRDAAARETMRVVSEVQAERDAARAKAVSFSAEERRKVAEEIARRIERMVPAHPRTWNGKWLVGRRMAADEARRVGDAS